MNYKRANTLEVINVILDILKVNHVGLYPEFIAIQIESDMKVKWRLMEDLIKIVNDAPLTVIRFDTKVLVNHLYDLLFYSYSERSQEIKSMTGKSR